LVAVVRSELLLPLPLPLLLLFVLLLLLLLLLLPLLLLLLLLLVLLPGKMDSLSMLNSGGGMSPDCTRLKKSSTELLRAPPYGRGPLPLPSPLRGTVTAGSNPRLLLRLKALPLLPRLLLRSKLLLPPVAAAGAGHRGPPAAAPPFAAPLPLPCASRRAQEVADGSSGFGGGGCVASGEVASLDKAAKRVACGGGPTGSPAGSPAGSSAGSPAESPPSSSQSAARA
jgi:hypothetical protein